MKLTAAAFALAAAAVVAVALAFGFSEFADAWAHLHPSWLMLAAAAELATFPAYALAYRLLARMDDGTDREALHLAQVIQLALRESGKAAAAEYPERAAAAFEHAGAPSG